MSGPLSPTDTPAAPSFDIPERCEIEVLEGRDAEVGGFAVRRVLPRRPRRTVGAWCFVDLMGPGEVDDRIGSISARTRTSACRP